MNRQEIIPLLLFFVIWATIYVTAASILIRGIWNWVKRRVGRMDRPPTTRFPWIKRGVLAVAGVGLLCMAYGYYVEPYWPQIIYTKIPCTKLPVGSPPLKIVHLSDLHCDPKIRLENLLPELVAAQNPDVILFTGDAANSTNGLPNFRALMNKLTLIAPVYAIRGNWDAASGPDDPFINTDVIPVGGKVIKTKLNGVEWCITGVDSGEEHLAAKVIRNLSPDQPTIFLSHYPALAKELASMNHENNQPLVDLVCSGHVHGGQVALPFYGALVTLSSTGKQYEAGLYRINKTWLYVSRGIGMEGEHAPRVRFLARPEVAVIELYSATAAP